MDKTKERKFVSVSRGLIISVLSTSTMVTSVLTVAQVGLEYRAKSREMDGLIVTMEASLIPAIRDKMWNLDVDGIKSQMAPVLPSMDASSIVLKNDKDEVVFESKLQDFIPEHPVYKTFEIRNVQTDGNNELIGKMDIVLFKDKIIKEVRNRFIIILILNSLKTFIVATVLLIIFHRKIAGPILEITTYFDKHRDLNNITGQDLNVNPRGGINDELTIMTEHIRRREQKLAEWSLAQKVKFEKAEMALAEADETIKHEKTRAEGSARLAQLGEMATSIAHEINNPLAIISGYNFLIRKEISKGELDSGKILSTTEAVEATTKRISKIITGLRAYARDGAQDPLEVASAARIIEDTVAMVETRLKTKAIAIQVDSASFKDIAMNCRSVQVVQVLVAMINNSFDAICDLENPWISLEVKQEGDKVYLALTDSGPGISPEFELKIFQPFFSTKPVGSGTGLGLSISFGIIRDHQGKIYVDHSCKNTRFVIEMPVDFSVQKTA
jgi:signal transduction histidine kinase